MTITAVRTEDVSPAERFDFWSAAHTDLFRHLRIYPLTEQTFFGSLLRQELGSLMLYRLITAPVAAIRAERCAPDADPEELKIVSPVRGVVRVVQDDRVCTLWPGDLTLLDMSESRRVENRNPAELAMLTLPRSLLHHDVSRIRRQVAVRVRADDSVGGLLGQLLHGLTSRLGESSYAEPCDAEEVGGERHDVDSGIELGHSISSLLRALYLPRLGHRESPGNGRRVELLRRVQSYILAHLDCPELTPERVAAEHFMSTRALYKLFEQEGVGVSEWIRGRRLERCRHDLVNGAEDGDNVLGIATRWGFTSPAHFSRLFKRTYGLSPTEYRRANRSESTTVLARH